MQNEIYILGSSSAMPTTERFSSSQVLKMNGKLFMIDCGEGTQIRLRQMKVRMQKIGHIFISHLHGDHYLGIMGLLSSLNLLGREHDIHIYTFPELKEVINMQIDLTGMLMQFKIHFHDLNDDALNLIYEDNTLSIYSFPLKHRMPTCGFLFKEKTKKLNIKKDFVEQQDIPIEWFERIKNGEDFVNFNGEIYKNEDITIQPPKPISYAYCSDTIYDENIIQYIKDVDVLFHEATFGWEFREIAKEKFHTTAKEAALIAQKANVSKLIIGHFSARYTNLEPLLEESREIFSNSYLAEDLQIISLKAY